MNIFLLMLVILFGLMFVLLAIPISISYSINTHQQLRGYSCVTWLFGLMKFHTDFPLEPKTKPTPLRDKKEPLAKASKRVTAKNNMSGIGWFKQSTFRCHTMTFINRLLAASHARELYLRCRIGLGDPADTGMLWAFMGPVSAMMTNVRFMKIELEPDFTDFGIEFKSHGHFKLIPLQVIGLIIIFILSPTTIRTWRMTQQKI